MSSFIEAATLVRLIDTGVIKESKRNTKFIKRYETALWLERSTRKAEWIIREDCQAHLEQRLGELFPSWKEDFVYLRSLGLNPYNPDDVKSLSILKQNNVAPTVINRRNWNAASGVGPKHKAKLRSESTITTDWIIRFRPNKGLRCYVDGRDIDLDKESSLYTECLFPERMWLKFEEFGGRPPDVLITCENLGPYIDLPITPTTMVVYSPGNDTVAATEVLRKLPNVKWVHFGDIDPAGFQIARNIAEATERDLEFYIPSFARNYLPGLSFKGGWGDFNGLENPVILELVKSKRRIFQEVFMLDPGLEEDISQRLRK